MDQLEIDSLSEETEECRKWEGVDLTSTERRKRRRGGDRVCLLLWPFPKVQIHEVLLLHAMYKRNVQLQIINPSQN